MLNNGHLKIMTPFQESFDNGILSKTHFQNSDVTQGFIKWLIPFINDGGENLDKIHLDHGGEYKNFNQAIDKYKWPLKGKSLFFKETIDKFNEWRKALKSPEQAQLLKTCMEILTWGRVLHVERLEKINNLRFFLDQMNNKLSQDEIIIYDLNSNYINSGFTKIYSALNETFIMYDGRVGASLCYLIRSYLESDNKINLPTELKFGWGWGQGKVSTRKNRNPNNEKSSFEKFEEITERNRELHFLSNIKANWLLEIIAKDNTVIVPQSINHAEKVFALQTALFVLGYELPKK